MLARFVDVYLANHVGNQVFQWKGSKPKGWDSSSFCGLLTLCVRVTWGVFLHVHHMSCKDLVETGEFSFSCIALFLSPDDTKISRSSPIFLRCYEFD